MVARKRNNGEGSIYRDQKRGRYVGEVVIDGRRRRVTAKTRTDCSAKLSALINDDIGRTIDRAATVANVLDDWAARALPAKGLAPSTYQRHLWAVGLWREHVGRVRAEELTAEKIERALDKMAAGRGLSHASLVKVKSTLSQALGWAVKRRTIKFNASIGVDLPASAAPPGQPFALDAKQLSRLLKTTDGHRLGPMFRVMARGGLRPGEAYALCVDALDLGGDPPNLSLIRGIQLDKGHPKLVDDLKTLGARRSIAVPADVVEALRDYLHSEGIDAGLLFVGSDGGPLWPTTVRSILRDLCDQAGVPRITPNQLRHTWTSLGVNEGGLAPHEVSAILGHRSTRMVEAVYWHRPAVILGADQFDLI